MPKARKKKTLLLYLSVILTTLILCVAVIYFLQPAMFFYPYHDADAYESLQKKMEDFQEITIPHKSGTLHGWLHRDPQTDSAPLVILYGGNGQNSSAYCRMFENTGVFHRFQGYDVLFVDYPGYGLSSGKPTEKTLFSAALAVYDFSRTIEETNGKVIILGYSIGTGVATYVASQRSIDGLILLAPYDRGLSLYNDVCNIFHGPLESLARFKFDSATYARQISVPPLLIASRDDEVIPYTHAVALGQHFPSLKELMIIDGIPHDAFFYSSQVLDGIQSYLSSVP